MYPQNKQFTPAAIITVLLLRISITISITFTVLVLTLAVQVYFMHWLTHNRTKCQNHYNKNFKKNGNLSNLCPTYQNSYEKKIKTIKGQIQGDSWKFLDHFYFVISRYGLQLMIVTIFVNQNKF